MKKNLKKFLALILTCTFIATLVPVTVLAVDTYSFSDFVQIDSWETNSASGPYRDLIITAYDYDTDFPMPTAYYSDGYLWVTGCGWSMSAGSKHALTIEKADHSAFTPTSVAVRFSTYRPNDSSPYETDTFRVTGYNASGSPIATEIYENVTTLSTITVDFSTFTDINKLEFSLDYNDFGITDLVLGIPDSSPTNTISSCAFSADTGTSSTDFITKTAAQTISGTLSANLASGESVYVSLDNGATWSAATSTVGQSTWSLAGQTLSGSNTLKIKVVDTEGNDGTVYSQAYVLDQTPPTSLIASCAFSADTGVSGSDFITKTAAQTISGTLSANLTAGEIVYVSLDNGATWSAATTTVGQNTWSLAGQTLSGSNTLKIKVTDTAGNDGTVYSQAYVLDQTSPTTSIATCALSADTGTSSTDFITNTASQTISGTLSANLTAGEIVYVSLNDGATWSAVTTTVGQNTWSLAGQTLSGSNTLKVKVTDTAGNDGTIFSQAYVLDQTSPTTSIATCAFSADTGVSGSDFITNTASQTISGTLSANLAVGESVYVSLDSGATWSTATATVGQNTWSLAGQTLSGSNTLKIKVTDTAGNDGSVYSRAYVLDTNASAPSTPDMTAGTDSGVSSTDNFTNVTTPTFTGTAEPNSTVMLCDTDGITVLGTGTADGSGNWSITSSALVEGTHTITAKVVDVAGNVSAASTGLTITIVTTAPSTPSTPDMTSDTDSGAASSDNFTNVTTPTFTGTAEANSSVKLYDTDGTTVLGTGTADGSGNWNITSTALVAGSHTITAKAIDAAGNVSAASSGLTITIDTTGSTVISVSVPSNATYISGRNLDFTLNLDENVTVTGTPQIALTIGSSTVYANYFSGSGTAALVFRYTAVLGDLDTDGITVGALGLNGGSIKDAAGNDATMTLNSVGSTAAVLVDATEPTVSSINRQNPMGESTNASSVVFRVTFSESVTGVDISDFTLTKTGAIDGSIASVSVASGTTIDVTVNSVSGDGTLRLDLNASGTGIEDSAGNAIAGGYTTGQTYTIDTVVPTVTITSTAPNSTNTSPIPVTIIFSEIVTGFTEEDLTVGNGLISNFSGSGTSYTMDITPSGDGTVTVDVAPNVAQDAAGNNNTAATQLSRVVDITAPTAGGTGTITPGNITSSSAALTWVAATDTITNSANLQYKVVYSLSNNIADLTNAKNNGTVFGGWIANTASATITGLTPSTGYYFNVIVKDEMGNEAVYTSITANTTAAPSSGGGSSTPTQPTNSAVVEVNGQKQDAGTANTQTTGGQTVTTITVDDGKLNKILAGSGANATVTLPTSGNSNIVVGVLNGQTVKTMEAKEAILEIKTGSVTYTLPASQINIDAVSDQIGTQVALKDIKVNVSIAEPSADTVKIVENTAAKNSYQIIVKPVDFEITCTSGDKKISVSKFNGYVERTVAIPDGVDPSKITTGIVLNSDGTFSHVPTQIMVINGKYYAKINSLTNSTYSVIYNHVEFEDITNHWAKNAINDMGSRMVVTGIGDCNYDPDRSITRAEFAAIVVRALGLRAGTEESEFGDVALPDWFNGFVDTATAYALITGYDSKNFGPNDTITREQAMAIIARAMKLTGMDVTLTNSETTALLSRYTDGAQVSAYAKESAAVCLKAGIVNGTTKSTISSKSFVTRAEVAVMVQRLLQESGLI